jgi:hypothetical protein
MPLLVTTVVGALYRHSSATYHFLDDLKFHFSKEKEVTHKIIL